jgi:hypothetical protein
MISTIILSSAILVTHAPGWSDLIITEDLWSYSAQQDNALLVTNTYVLHQFWDRLNQQTRIGYKSYMPEGTIVFPETMVSGDVSSGDPTATLLGDSVAGFWRQGIPAWYCVRDSTGGELLPTSLFQSDTYLNRLFVEVASDSLGRIHAATVVPAGVLYTVTEPGFGEVWRDTVPGSQHETAGIQVDGNRVHIIYRVGYATPMYVQYDLDGNITIPAVTLTEGLVDLYPLFSTAVDVNGDMWYFTPATRSYNYITLFKVHGETGEVLISDQEVVTPGASKNYPTILPDPSEDKLYLMWIANDGNFNYWVYFAVIDTNGDYIEEPYPAYDYSDEEEQNIFVLNAAVNELGDIFAIWSAYYPEVHPNAYYIVMGWFDHNWLAIREEETVTGIGPLSICPSCNPVTGSVSFTITGVSPNELEIYDISGRLVATVPVNSNTAFWDGKDASGVWLPFGVYRVSCGDVSTTVTLLGD